MPIPQQESNFDTLIGELPTSDEKQEDEEVSITDKDDAKLRQGKRHAVHYLWIGMLWFLGVMLCICTAVYLWHNLMGECLCWLSDEKLDTIKTLLCTAWSAIGTYVISSFCKHI